MRPSTSVQISTRPALSAAPRSEALKSEPPRPSVVGTPLAVAPMKPCVTGTTPRSRSGTSCWRARVLSTCVYGVARPKRSSVTMTVRTSTHWAGTPPPQSAAVTRRELQSSPRPVIASSSHGVARRPPIASSSAASAAASARMGSIAAMAPGSSRAVASWRATISVSRSRKPEPPISARRASPSRASVTPPSADTTTSGCSAVRSRMILMRRWMAGASWTDVPPNLQTIIVFSRHAPFRGQQLCDLHRRSRRAPDRVVAQQDEPQVEQRARPHPSYRHRHPLAAVEVESRLGPVGPEVNLDRSRRRRGKTPHALRPAEPAERRDRLRRRGAAAESHGDRLEVAVHGGHPVALRAHHERGRLHGAVRQPAEDLAGFLLHLLLFAADQRHHVAQDVE